MNSTCGAFDPEAVAVEPATADIGAVKTKPKPCDNVDGPPIAIGTGILALSGRYV